MNDNFAGYYILNRLEGNNNGIREARKKEATEVTTDDVEGTYKCFNCQEEKEKMKFFKCCEERGIKNC